MNITFIHGWGMDNRVWDGVIANSDIKNPNFIDLGFIEGQKSPKSPAKSQKSIYITHSLGGLWALRYKKHDIDGLIVINGFTKFTNFVDERILLTMQKHLKRNHEKLMNEFWDNIDLPANLRSNNLNLDRLNEGLEWLINWDVSTKLSALNVPLLSLSGDKDPLLSNKEMKKQWAGVTMKTNKDGGHILPLTHPKWCAVQIKEFISEFKLEK